MHNIPTAYWYIMTFLLFIENPITTQCHSSDYSVLMSIFTFYLLGHRIHSHTNNITIFKWHTEGGKIPRPAIMFQIRAGKRRPLTSKNGNLWKFHPAWRASLNHEVEPELLTFSNKIISSIKLHKDNVSVFFRSIIIPVAQSRQFVQSGPGPQQLCVSSLAHWGPPGPPPLWTAGHFSLSADGSAAPPADGQKKKKSRQFVIRWTELFGHCVRQTRQRFVAGSHIKPLHTCTQFKNYI